MAEIAVVTVVYRAGDQALQWADALERAWAPLKASEHSLRVIAVDNASGDETPDRLRSAAPFVTLLQQPGNLGFAAGCNRGLSEVGRDELVVLLNPDVMVHSTFFETLVAIEWPDRLAAIGPQIQTSDGNIEQSARSFPTLATGAFGRTTLLSRLLPGSRAVRRQLLADPSRGVVRVDWVSGACLIAPRDRFESVGLLDEAYWMYWEDADWCRRAANTGYEVEYHPELLAMHIQGSSSRTRPVRTIVAFHRSAARYYARHVAKSRSGAVAASTMLVARLLLKLAVTGARRARSSARGAA